MRDYIATGIATRLVDPDGGQHAGAQQLSMTSWALPSDGWTNKLDNLPKFSYAHLFAHLVSNSKTVAANQKSSAKKTYATTGAMKHKEAGYRLFQDDHVKRVKFHPGCTDQNLCFFTALVQASFKTSVHYSTSVCLYSSNGAVCGAHCKCKAGGGGCCKHVAALLYCVLDYCDRQLTLIPDHKTCTDKPQQWNVAKKSMDGPILFSDILIVHHTYGKRKAEEECARTSKRKEYRACPTSLQAVSEDQIRALCTSLESHTANPPFPKVLRGNECRPWPLADIEACSSSSLSLPGDDPNSCSIQLNSDATISETPNSSTAQNDSVSCIDKEITTVTHSTNAKEAVFAYVRVSQEEAEKIQLETKEQSQSLVWYKERQCRITASYFGRVCKMRPTTSGSKLATTITSQCQKKFTPVACAWGKDNEPLAVEAYIQYMAMQQRPITVSQTGLIINPNFSYLGASPDGLLTDCNGTDPSGILEIKCPYKYRDVDPCEAAGNKDFCSELTGDTLTLKRSHNYYYQIQGQMAISSRKWCDFVIYTNKKVSVERISFDEPHWMTMLPKLTDFYTKELVPILEKRLHTM